MAVSKTACVITSSSNAEMDSFSASTATFSSDILVAFGGDQEKRQISKDVGMDRLTDKSNQP